jgi:hypothetical protein
VRQFISGADHDWGVLQWAPKLPEVRCLLPRAWVAQHLRNSVASCAASGGRWFGRAAPHGEDALGYIGAHTQPSAPRAFLELIFAALPCHTGSRFHQLNPTFDKFMPMDDHTITNELIEIGMKVDVRPCLRFYTHLLFTCH